MLVVGLVLTVSIGHGEAAAARWPEREYQPVRIVAVVGAATDGVGSAGEKPAADASPTGLGRLADGVNVRGAEPEPAASTSATADHSALFSVINAIAVVFPVSMQRSALAVALCESGADPANHIIDIDGLPRAGAWSVGERWWGPVSTDPVAQAQQVLDIVNTYGWHPWTCSVVLS